MKAIGHYLYLPEVRKREVEKAVDRKDFHGALQLVKKVQVKLCRELFVLHGGSMDYYRELRKLVDPKEWKDFLTKLLSETDTHAWYSSDIKTDIYVEEQDWQNLFALLIDANHHSLDMFDNYAHHLKSTHSAELLVLHLFNSFNQFHIAYK